MQERLFAEGDRWPKKIGKVIVLAVLVLAAALLVTFAYELGGVIP